MEIFAGKAHLQKGVNEILSVFSTSYLICIICAEDVLQNYINCEFHESRRSQNHTYLRA